MKWDQFIYKAALDKSNQ